MLPIIVLYGFSQRYVIGGLTEGSLKRPIPIPRSQRLLPGFSVVRRMRFLGRVHSEGTWDTVKSDFGNVSQNPTKEIQGCRQKRLLQTYR